MDLNLILIITFSILSPVIGSLIGIIKKPSDNTMYNLLSFAAAVMISISFLELIPESLEHGSVILASIGFVLGAIIMYGLDRIIPHIHPELLEQEQGKSLKKSSLFIFWGIFLHNFPEGMAMAAGAVTDFKLSLAIALGLAIHNIPEGILTSAPYYKATGKRLKAFLISASTAIPVALGFFVAYFLLQNVSDTVMSLMFAATAAIMIYISVDELIPASSFKLTNHSTIFSFIAGILLVLLLGLL